MGCVVLSSDDEEIVRGLRQDDSDSLERLMAAHRQRLVRYAEGILDGNGNGEDAVQEAFFRLWMHRHDLTVSGSLRAFLYTLTRNAAIDERRRSTRRAVAARAAGAPAPPPSPLEAAVASELAGAATTAVSTLPARRREVFTRARLEGCTHREIAVAMGLSPQTVANQMSAAMASLRQTLACYGVTAHGPVRDRAMPGSARSITYTRA
jgi:RNA polymerase sigma-70 factor (ECF subfamily)